jgi:hypothetical protein
VIHRIPKTKVRGALTLREIAGKSDEDLERLRREGWLLPVAGGAPDDDEDEDEGAKKKKAPKNEDDEDDDEQITVSKSELEGLKQTVGAVRKENRKLKAAAEEADDEDAKEAGRYKDLYEKEKAKNAELQTENADLTKGQMAREVAARLNFHNPERAVRMIELDDIDNEGDAERALKSLAKSDSYMVNAKKRTSGKVGDDDPAGSKDGEDDKAEQKTGAVDTRTPTQKMADAYAATESNSAQE